MVMNDKYIVYFISKTKKKMKKFIENSLLEKGINDIVPSYGNILTVLYDNNGQLKMNEIGKILGKDKSTITTLVNNLEKRGYVEKVRSSEDKRAVYVSLTDKARQIEPVFNQISAEVHKTAYKGFTNEEKEELLRLLKKLNKNFSDRG
jgi:DNA-binding MarR family transcriptional regulator